MPHSKGKNQPVLLRLEKPHQRYSNQPVNTDPVYDFADATEVWLFAALITTSSAA
jgi:hypothetical protein